MTRSLWLLLAAALPTAAQTPVETGVYRVGAWFPVWTEAGLARYRQAGFNLIPYTDAWADWAVEHGFQFINTVSQRGLPTGVNQPFEADDGTRSMSVGLFTSLNFNAPTVAEWWRTAVPQQVGETKHPEAVAYWKVHNEFGYHAAKFWDYSPGSIAKYRAWLTHRYGTIAELNRQWQTDWASFDAIEPPRRLPPESMANWLDWRRYTSWSFADYFRDTGDLIRSVVPGAQTSDNFYPTSPLQGWDMFELARQTDYLAFDIYAIGRWTALLRQLDLGRSSAAAWGRPFSMMEYHAGPNNWVHAVTAEDLWIEAAVALGRECRSIQWFRFAPGNSGREQGIHAVLDSTGGPTERLTAVRDISEKTARLAPLLARARIRPAVAVLWSADDSYLAAGQRRPESAPRVQAERFQTILDAARIAHELIDPTALLARERWDYRALAIPGTQVIPDALQARLEAYIAQGGTVLWLADSGQCNEFGQPRADAVPPATAPRGAWTAPPQPGRWGLQADWGIEPGESPEVDSQRATALAALLAEHAGVEPTATLEAAPYPGTIDVQRLTDDSADLLFLSHLYPKGMLWQDDWDYHPEQAPRDLVVTIPAGGVTGEFAYGLLPGSAALERWPLTRRDGHLTFTIPHLAPTAWVLLPKAWQPVVGLTVPGRVTPGNSLPIAVTVDNLGAETVGGEVTLTLPDGWLATPNGPGATFAGLAPGERAEVPYQLTIPAGAALDPFAVEHGLTATVSLTTGRTGQLTATATPAVVPALEAELAWQGQVLNPHQEMAPALMRWGWEREVHIPPPPPVSIAAATPMSVTLWAAPALAGQTVALSLEPEGSLTPPTVALTGARQVVDATVNLAQPGPHQLVMTVGPQRWTAEFDAGINTETVQALLASAPPATGGRVLGSLAVGARSAPARLSPVRVPLALDGAAGPGLRLLDDQGQPVPAEFADSSVLLAADVPVDQARRYTVVQPDAATAPAAPRALTVEPTPAGLLVRGQGYGVELDTRLGVIRRLLGPGDAPVGPYRTGVVARLTDGAEWVPDGAAGATDLATSVNAVVGQLEFGRPLGPERALQVNERWTLEGHRIAVALTIRNVAGHPLDLAGLDYELGLDPEALPRWRRVGPSGTVTGGEMPEAMTGTEHDPLLDILRADGAGFGIRLGRNALATKWQSGFAGLFHSPARTRLGLFGGLRLDPGDTILTEFELWPHVTELDSAEANVPELISAGQAGG